MLLNLLVVVSILNKLQKSLFRFLIIYLYLNYNNSTFHSFYSFLFFKKLYKMLNLKNLNPPNCWPVNSSLALYERQAIKKIIYFGDFLNKFFICYIDDLVISKKKTVLGCKIFMTTNFVSCFSILIFRLNMNRIEFDTFYDQNVLMDQIFSCKRLKLAAVCYSLYFNT